MAECSPIRIASVPQRHTAVVRAQGLSVGDLERFMHAAYRALGDAMATGQLHPAGPPLSRYDSDLNDRVDLETGYPLAEPLAEPIVIGDVAIIPSELPATEIATTTLRGGHADLPAAWAQLVTGAETAGRTPTRPYWETYLTKPMPGFEPDTMETELVVALAPLAP